MTHDPRPEWTEKVDDWVRFVGGLQLADPEWKGGVSTELLRGLKDALYSPQPTWTARAILEALPWEYTQALAAEIVDLSLSHAFTTEARALLGRIPYLEAARSVPPVVARMLDDADDDAYRRLGELLEHLGLFDALADLCHRAASSEDEDIREVAQDFPPSRETGWHGKHACGSDGDADPRG